MLQITSRSGSIWETEKYGGAGKIWDMLRVRNKPCDIDCPLRPTSAAIDAFSHKCGTLMMLCLEFIALIYCFLVLRIYIRVTVPLGFGQRIIYEEI